MTWLDRLPHDDSAAQGVDWDACAWCGEAWALPGCADSMPPDATPQPDRLNKTRHVVTCPHTDAEGKAFACPGCVESGRADTHPDEE